MEYKVSDDLALAEFMFNYTKDQLAFDLAIPRITLNRIMDKKTYPSNSTLEKIYDYFYKKGLKINEIKAGVYDDELINGKLLFHGSKSEIIGEISPFFGKKHNDFGQAFYCAEAYGQTSMFISRFENSSLYLLDFVSDGLKKIELDISQEWMLAVAYFRGTLDKYKDHPLLKRIINKVKAVDYLIAPIADNRMFNIIDRFIEGEISDQQCIHSLASSRLGKQYVFLTAKATSQIKILERCYICQKEKDENKIKRNDDLSFSDSLVKEAMIKYRGKGKYIEEIFNEKV